MWRVQCGGGGVSVRTYAYDKCNIDLVQGQYRAEYLPSRLRRSGRYSPVLPLYSVNITYVRANITFIACLPHSATSAGTHFPHCTTAISVKSALFIMIVQNQHDFVRIMKGLTIHDGKMQHLAASALRCRGNLSMFRFLLL